MIAQSRGHAVLPLAHHSFNARAATVVQAYCGYLGKMAVPVNLAPIYPLPKTTNYTAAIACAIGLVVITTLLVLAGRTRRYLAVGWFWYLGMLVPVIGIVHVGAQSMADRYTYMPLVGIFILVAWSAAEAVAHWPRLKQPLVWLTVAGLAGCCLLTSAQVRLWASTETLFTHAAMVAEDSPTIRTNLGLVALHKEDYAEAQRQFREALRLEPTDIYAMGNLATLFLRQKKYDEALKQYQQIHLCWPDNPKLFSEMARAFGEQGNRPREEACLRRALELEPASASLYHRLALNQQVQGKTQEALDKLLDGPSIQTRRARNLE